MNTIEERAELFAGAYPHINDVDLPYFVKEAYIAGAKTQKALDDEEYRKDMQYVNVKKQELMDKIRKAYCKYNCPHLVEYCWQDETEIPCAGIREINKSMDK